MAKRTNPSLIGLRVSSLLFLFASLPAAGSDSPKPTDPPKTFDLAGIDAYVAGYVRDHGYAGLSLAIVREGKLIFAKGYGKRSLEDGAPVEPCSGCSSGGPRYAQIIPPPSQVGYDAIVTFVLNSESGGSDGMSTQTPLRSNFQPW